MLSQLSVHEGLLPKGHLPWRSVRRQLEDVVMIELILDKYLGVLICELLQKKLSRYNFFSGVSRKTLAGENSI